jgi:hypothetical protein
MVRSAASSGRGGRIDALTVLLLFWCIECPDDGAGPPSTTDPIWRHADLHLRIGRTRSVS